MNESDRKRTLYVGGLQEKVDASVLKAAFIPFGEIKDVQLPMDNATGTKTVVKTALVYDGPNDNLRRLPIYDRKT